MISNSNIGIKSEDEFKIGEIKANGLKFSYIEIGDGPLIIALHGFPDLPYSFSNQMKFLAEKKYRVVAPFMRGYFPTEAPIDASYESAILVQDILALIDVFSKQPVILLGHDWGAQAGYGAAIVAPQKILKLITIAVPIGFSKSLINNAMQQRRSWYMGFFNIFYSEIAVAFNDFEFIEKLWQDWSPGWNYQKDAIVKVKKTFKEPNVLQATLNYYRHSLNPSNYKEELAYIRNRMNDDVTVPTLYIHGENDGCIGVETCIGMEKRFTNKLYKKIVPDAGHFVHQEKFEMVNNTILNFLNEQI